MPAVTQYTQVLTVTLTRDGLDYTCTIDATPDDTNAAWNVTGTKPTRAAAISEALRLAKHEMRAEIDVA